MIDNRYIAVEGPIGVGKTSLSEKLSECFNAELILEKSNDNPFLKNFYRDKDRYGFQTQTFFLLNRYSQLLELAQRSLFHDGTVCDYVFQKDMLFASLNLNKDEFSLYENFYNLLKPKIPAPDLVIFLQAGTDVLMNRIRKRGRDFEKNITFEYLEEVNRAYNNFFFHYLESPLLVINTADVDFVEDKKALDDLVQKIYHHRSGLQYYVPAGAK
ncbi:MAG: deoxynucleoside kinase [Nitrospinota bacterium]